MQSELPFFRDGARDWQALEPVAHAALAFTPTVAIQPPDGCSSRRLQGRLARDGHDGAQHPGRAAAVEAAPHTVLLEVESSLRYFGGRLRLLQRLHAALEPLKHCIHSVSAPTAQGAALLARVHRQLHCADLAAMREALDTVRCGCSARAASTGTPCRAWVCAPWATCTSCRAPAWRGASARLC